MKENILIPKVLWIAIVSLAVFGILHFIMGLSRPIQFIAFAVNILLIFGLLRLAIWAYFLSILASLIAPFMLLFQESRYFYIVLVLNLTVLIPVLISTKFFFSSPEKQGVQEESLIK